MSYSLNSLKAGYIGDYIGETVMGVIQGDTRSLDYSSDDTVPRMVLAVCQMFRLHEFVLEIELLHERATHVDTTSSPSVVPSRFSSKLSSCMEHPHSSNQSQALAWSVAVNLARA